MPEIRDVTGRPLAGEYADYAREDIEHVAGDDAITALEAARDATLELFGSLDDASVAGLTYAPGKWTVKEMLGHLVDDERIFAYRALCVARGDGNPMPGFDENAYMLHAGFEERPLADLLDEYRAVRAASIALFRGLDRESWLRKGMVNGYEASVRGLAFHIVGHELHHHRVLQERYLTRLD